MQLFSAEILSSAQHIIDIAKEKSLKIALAESCTGGLLFSALSEIAGSSQVLEASFVTYSYAAKSHTLGVSPTLLAKHGAVSNECVEAMVAGTFKASPESHIALSISGIAGPTGGLPNKPVGLVYFAYGFKDKKTATIHHIFKGSRTDVRLGAVSFALDVLTKLLAE